MIFKKRTQPKRLKELIAETKLEDALVTIPDEIKTDLKARQEETHFEEDLIDFERPLFHLSMERIK